MTTKNYAFFILLLVTLASCYDREREERLTMRERNLLVKEKQFALKEAEYYALLKMRDSILAVKDTLAMISTWPEYIEGQWSARVVCTESNCPDYVVGDQRNDTWIFSSDSTQLVTKVVTNNKLVRVYKASYTADIINLHFRSDSSSSRQVVMNVVLNDLMENKMRGIRILSIDNRCTAKFNVELNRIATTE